MDRTADGGEHKYEAHSAIVARVQCGQALLDRHGLASRIQRETASSILMDTLSKTGNWNADAILPSANLTWPAEICGSGTVESTPIQFLPFHTSTHAW